jgi:hypothetical protein
MLRSSVLVLTLVMTSAASAVAQAEIFFRVDGVQLPVPEPLENQWQRVLAKDHWRTVTGQVVHGHFKRFVIRRFDVFINADGKQLVKVTWMAGGKCRTKIIPVDQLDEKQKRLLTAIFRQPLHSINGRKTADVVFCEIDAKDKSGAGPGDLGDEGSSQRIRREDKANSDDAPPSDKPTGDKPGEETRPRDEKPPRDETNGNEQGGDETDGNDEAGNEQGGGKPGQLIPYRQLVGEGKVLLLPFANAARVSFQRRLSSADCREQEKDDDDDKTDGDPDDDDGTESDGDDKQDKLRKFGFHVKKFKSQPGSLIFNLVREFDVCILAKDLPTAFRKLREKFPQAVNQADRSRTSYRFRPSSKACPKDKPKVDDEDGNDKLTPVDDPLNEGSNPIDETAIPK